MWGLIVKKRVPPTRFARYCCYELKEHGGDRRFVVTGVRWAESLKRRNNRGILEISFRSKRQKIMLIDDNNEARKMIEQCQMKSKHILNPIVDWEDEDVWEFIKGNNLPYCKLYDKGFKRLGCIGCPIQGKKGMIRDFDRWPTYKVMYIKSFQKMVDKRIEDGLKTDWKTGEEVFNWWLGQ